MLASPAMEGRGVGTAGLDRAADFIEQRFADLHLTPLQSLRSFRQPFHAASTQPAATQPVTIANIIAERVGTRADEFIIVGAHYDHLGYGGRTSATPWDHHLHPGADDNASGTAAVLALARRFATGQKPARSILFVCFAGEERGLLGSAHFVDQPPIELSHVVAMINLDMIGRLRDDRVYVGGEGTADGFTDLVRRADRQPDLELKTFTLGGGGPSDHLAFSGRCIPVLFFFTGLHMDYHTPRDLPERVNFDGQQRIVALVANCIDELTRLPKPKYRDNHDRDASILSPPGRRPKLSLGLGLTEDPGQAGVRVIAVAPDSAALNAVKVGDRLLAIDGRPVNSLADVAQSEQFFMPGDQLRITMASEQGRPVVQRIVLPAN